MQLTKLIQVKVSEEMREKLQEITARNNHNLSGLIRSYLNEYIKENEHAENKK